MVRFDVVSLLPDMFNALRQGVTGRAIEQGIAELVLWNPRDYTQDKHRTVDDRPYGGGPGMLMMVEPLQAAIAGQGVILGSEPILKGLVETGLLVNPFKAVATTNVGYDLVTTPDLAMKESVRRFCDWVKTLARGDRD